MAHAPTDISRLFTPLIYANPLVAPRQGLYRCRAGLKTAANQLFAMRNMAGRIMGLTMPKG